MELFKLLGTIAIDNTKADEAIDETTKKAKDSEGQQSSAFKKIGGAAVAGAKVIAGAATAVGGGEAGKEAILPINTLQAYIDESVNSRNNDLIESLEMQISRLISFLQAYFPIDYQIMLDTGILAGQLAPEMNDRLAEIYRHNLRGNTR